jgi:hypothetical protein
MANLFCWTYDIGSAVHGGTKATRDTGYFLLQSGWKSLDTTCSGSNFRRALQLGGHIVKLCRMPSDSIVLVQFPAYGIASRILLHVITRRFKSIVLVHDLESLRRKSAGSSEAALKQASFIIFTGKLQTRLADINHIPSTTLEAWDYRLEPAYRSPIWDPAGSILFAGNLSAGKNGWLYQSCPTRPGLLLYGNQYQKHLNSNDGDVYRGEFMPDQPRFEGPISWGLLWEGNATSRRTEGTTDGYYELFNQPHKLSLYLACGLPVIAWRKAAVSDFVKRHQCGILVDELEDIRTQLQKYSQAELLGFRENAVRLSARVRSGDFIRAAVSQFAPMTSTLNAEDTENERPPRSLAQFAPERPERIEQ